MPPAHTTELPDDIDALRSMVASLQEQALSDQQALTTERERNSTLEKHSSTLEQHIAVLESQLAALRRMQFGKRSEKLDEQVRQLELMLEDLEATTAELPPIVEPDAVESAKKSAKARNPLPESLPRDTIEHGKRDVCEQCGNALSFIGEDVSEQLEYIPASFRVIRNVRPKYSCSCCDCIIQAPAPSRPISRGYAGPGLLAHVAVAKYADHLPLYRQSAIYAREGVTLERSTLADWIGQICRLLRPLDDALNHYVMAASKLHGDDTPVPVLQPGRKTTKLGRLWGYLRDDRAAGCSDAPAVWFSYSPDRKGKWPAEHLADFTGTLQADGYAGYNALYATNRIQEAACWAHVRRKFFDIDKKQPDSFAGEVLASIAALYGIEKSIKGQLPEEREVVRQARASPIVKKLKNQLQSTLSTVSKKMPLAIAIRYALTRWDALSVYISDGSIEIDNNPIEREIRPIALGRKNYLFAGSDAGGERAARLYSLLNTAKLNGLDPEKYLAHVLSRIADHPVNAVDELLPWNVKDTVG